MASPSPDKNNSYREALTLFRREKFPEAAEILEALVREDPAFEDALEALSVTYSKLKRTDDALQTARQWVRLNPKAIMAHTNLSRFYLEKGMIAEAEKEQAEARRLGWIEELKQKKMELPKSDPKEKIERFQKVIALDPKDVLGYYSLGEAYLENCLLPEAIETFKKGLAADPGHSASYYGLGQAYEAAKEFSKARETYTAGIKIAGEKGDVMTQKKMEARLRQLSNKNFSEPSS